MSDIPRRIETTDEPDVCDTVRLETFSDGAFAIVIPVGAATVGANA